MRKRSDATKQIEKTVRKIVNQRDDWYHYAKKLEELVKEQINAHGANGFYYSAALLRDRLDNLTKPEIWWEEGDNQ